MLPSTRFELILATETDLREIEWFTFGNVYVAGHEPHIRRFSVAYFQLIIYTDFVRQRCNGARISKRVY